MDLALIVSICSLHDKDLMNTCIKQHIHYSTLDLASTHQNIRMVNQYFDYRLHLQLDTTA